MRYTKAFLLSRSKHLNLSGRFLFQLDKFSHILREESLDLYLYRKCIHCASIYPCISFRFRNISFWAHLMKAFSTVHPLIHLCALTWAFTIQKWAFVEILILPWFALKIVDMLYIGILCPWCNIHYSTKWIKYFFSIILWLPALGLLLFSMVTAQNWYFSCIARAGSLFNVLHIFCSAWYSQGQVWI